MNKRVLQLGAAALVGAFALSACGGGTPNTTGGGGGETPTEPGGLETSISILAPSYADSSEAEPV